MTSNIGFSLSLQKSFLEQNVGFLKSSESLLRRDRKLSSESLLRRDRKLVMTSQLPLDFRMVSNYRKNSSKARKLYINSTLQKIPVGKAVEEHSDFVEDFVNPLLETVDHVGLEAIEEESLESLEWPKVCKQVSKFTSTSMATKLAREGLIPIGGDLHSSERLLAQTASVLLLSNDFDFSAIEDITPIVNSASTGETCTVRQLCAVRKTIVSGRKIFEQLCKFASGASDNSVEPLLQIFETVDFCKDLEVDLDHCIDYNYLSIQDRASPVLTSVRSKRKMNMAELDKLLKDIADRIAEARAIDSPVVTKRRSRQCVGIKASRRSFLPGGIVLGVSSSGATYFMEPKDALHLNNAEIQLAAEQRHEELAILRRLSEKIASKAKNIRNILEKILVLDLACARAKHASWLGSVCPIFTQEEGMESSKPENISETSESARYLVYIEKISHPLLLESALKGQFLSPGSDVMSKKFPVPIDIKVELGKKVVIISGPNTGGKTAALKTLGLLSIMAKAGLFLPAIGSPRLPWFDHIMADVGDNQSLEQSLSTYGGHIRNICNILEVGTKKSVVLIDEIGSGTDPAEGVALATSILQHLASSVSLTVVTTHYSDLCDLKTQDDRFENAAMEFDLKTLYPTFNILWGCRGQSNALDVAQSIGFDINILDRAREWVNQLRPDRQKKRQSELFKSLVDQRDNLQYQILQSTLILEEAKNLKAELHAETEHLEERVAALKLKEKENIEKQVEDAKAKMEIVVTNFERQLKEDDANVGLKEVQTAINSIVTTFCPSEMNIEDRNASFYPALKIGDKVTVKQLGSEPATIVEAPSEKDKHVVVKVGKLRMRVKLNDIEAQG